MTLAQILDELERRANIIHEEGTFEGKNATFAEIMLAGFQMMDEGYENRKTN